MGLDFSTLDSMLGKELLQRLDTGQIDPAFSDIFRDLPSKQVQKIVGAVFGDDQNDLPLESELHPGQESIIDLFKRPSILIQKGKFEPPESEIWNQILTDNMSKFDNIIPAVGRIEMEDHEKYDWAGTGFIIEDGILVTNRHVAKYFVDLEAEPPTFRVTDKGRRIKPSIDILEEHAAVVDEEEYAISDVLYIEPEGGPDIAFLKCPGTPKKIGIDNLSDDVSANDYVAAIGYPYEDGRIKEKLKEAAKRIFADIYGVKRLAPGRVGRANSHILTYDCTTLGGNSGSAVVRIDTGKLVGLHSDGAVTKNIGVSSSVIRDRLNKIHI